MFEYLNFATSKQIMESKKFDTSPNRTIEIWEAFRKVNRSDEYRLSRTIRRYWWVRRQLLLRPNQDRIRTAVRLLRAAVKKSAPARRIVDARVSVLGA